MVGFLTVSFALFATLSAQGLIRRSWHQALEGAFLSVCLMVGTGVVDVALFPEYPLKGPHELLVLTTYIPAALGAAIYAWRRGADERGVLRGALVFAAFSIAILCTPGVARWNIETALPLSAVVSRTISFDPIPDMMYEYTMDVEPFSSEEFDRYARRLSLTPDQREQDRCWRPPPNEGGRCPLICYHQSVLIVSDFCGP